MKLNHCFLLILFMATITSFPVFLLAQGFDNGGAITSVDPMIFSADGLNHIITITGHGFSKYSRVYVDDAPINSTLIDDEHISLALSYFATGSHTIDVRGQSGTVSSTWEDGLFALGPSGIAIWPPAGSVVGGDTVQVYGNDNSFEPGAQVLFGASFTSGTSWLTSGHLEVETPSGASGYVGVTIDNPTYPDITQSNSFEYFDSAQALRGSQYISSGSILPPTSMYTGQTFAVTIKMKNTGTDNWTRTKTYKLGIRPLPDPDIWGPNRVYLTSTDNILTNQTKTFTFTITAPISPGVYQFQTQMIQENAHVWFGDYGPATAINITVTAPTPSTCPVSDVNNATADIQQCLNDVPANCTGDACRVRLAPTTNAYMIVPNSGHGLRIHVDNTILESSNAPCNEFSNPKCAELKASPDLSSPLIASESGVDDYTLRYIVLNGNKAGRWENGYNCPLNTPNNNGSNAALGGRRFRVQNIWSRAALCGSALSIDCIDQCEVSSSTIYSNGYPNGGINPDPAPLSDGITVLTCNMSSSDKSYSIRKNNIFDNTDIGIVIGGHGSVSGAGGCDVRHNTIQSNTVRSHGGIHVMSFPCNGGGNHTGGVYKNNDISSGSSLMPFGYLVGPHPFDTGLYTTGGSITGNDTITGAVVNLAIDGACSANVARNTMTNAQGHFSDIIHNCSFSGNFTAADCYNVSTSGNSPATYTLEYFHEPNCASAGACSTSACPSDTHGCN